MFFPKIHQSKLASTFCYNFSSTNFNYSNRVVVILLNFEILGEMEIKTGGEATQPAKPVQNENIEPKKQETKTAPPSAKSFFNNKESQNPVQNSGKLAASNNAGKEEQPGMFNGFKIFGISSLNPYQNK